MLTLIKTQSWSGYISIKMNFATKNITNDKYYHLIIKKMPVNQENMTILEELYMS